MINVDEFNPAGGIARDTVTEVVSPRIYADFAAGDILTFYEFNEQSNVYTDSRPITMRVTSVVGHDNDPEDIEFGSFRLTFEPVTPAAEPPPKQFTPQ